MARKNLTDYKKLYDDIKEFVYFKPNFGKLSNYDKQKIKKYHYIYAVYLNNKSYLYKPRKKANRQTALNHAHIPQKYHKEMKIIPIPTEFYHSEPGQTKIKFNSKGKIKVIQKAPNSKVISNKVFHPINTSIFTKSEKAIINYFDKFSKKFGKNDLLNLKIGAFSYSESWKGGVFNKKILDFIFQYITTGDIPGKIITGIEQTTYTGQKRGYKTNKKVIGKHKKDIKNKKKPVKRNPKFKRKGRVK